MAKKNMKTENQNPGMMLVLTFLIMFLINSLVILLAHSFFPENVVLGTVHISETAAVILSMGVLALINTFSLPFITEWELRTGSKFTNMQWMVAYFVINFVGIWVVARFAEVLGLGISSWMVAAVLAIILDGVQGLVMMQVEKKRLATVSA